MAGRTNQPAGGTESGDREGSQHRGDTSLNLTRVSRGPEVVKREGKQKDTSENFPNMVKPITLQIREVLTNLLSTKESTQIAGIQSERGKLKATERADTLHRQQQGTWSPASRRDGAGPETVGHKPRVSA